MDKGQVVSNAVERYSFEAEWYDSNAALIRKYLLNYYPSDNTIEMVSAAE